MALPQKSSRRFPVRAVAIIAALVLLAVAAWYFTRPKPMTVHLAKVERGHGGSDGQQHPRGNGQGVPPRQAGSAGGRPDRASAGEEGTARQGQPGIAGVVEQRPGSAASAWRRNNSAQHRPRRIRPVSRPIWLKRKPTRAQQLKEKGFISAEGLDQKVSAAKVSRAGCEAARSQIDQSRSRIAVANASLQRMVLRAPFAGVVADISGELGEYATPSPPGIPTLPAIDLIDDSCMFVSAPIDEVDAANIKVGQQARITLDAIKGKTFAGKVKRIAPYVLELEKQARTVEVEVEFDQPPDAENLLVGYSADVEIVHDSHQNVLRIPTQALLEGKRVLLYRPDGVLEERSRDHGPGQLGLHRDHLRPERRATRS